ncbi:MAG: alanine racemase [Halioglobus sp.]
MSRPTKALISRSALRHNAGVAKALAPHSQVMAVIKANAYGHGATDVATALHEHVDAFAVACVEEAIELRSCGIQLPILLLEGVFSDDEIESAAELRLWLTIEKNAQLHALLNSDAAEAIECWVKVDTGMHRLGFSPEQAAAAWEQLNQSHKATNDVVLFTHFADAETIGGEPTAHQLALFNNVNVKASRSACNSAGLLTLAQAHFDWVRPGYMIYGNSPLEEPHPNTTSLRPAMTLCSAISSLRTLVAGQTVGYGGTWRAQRKTTIATVPIGYGDGYPRSAPAGTPVLVNGQRAPLAGRVSMDMITLDVTDLADIALGDEVILWGPELPVDEIAIHAGTNGYELTTRMPARTPRIFVDD